MKKILITLFCFFTFAFSLQSQGLTDTLGNTKRSLTDIYNEIFGTNITAMKDICESYTIAIAPVDDTSKILISNESDLSPFWIQDSEDKYIGKFRATDEPDLWFRAYYTVGSTFQYTIKFIDIIR